MALIKTFEEACLVKGLDPQTVLPDFSKFPAEHQQALTDYAKMVIIADVLNEGWKPNWKDTNQQKFYPFFEMDKHPYNKEGFRLSGVFGYCTRSYVGSRLCFQTREIARYAAETFLDLYKSIFTL